MRLALNLARRIGRHVLEVQVMQLAVAQQVEVFELTDAAPEMIRIEHHADVRMIGLANDFEGRRERADES